MSGESSVFKGTIDRYNGVTIDTEAESIDANTFPQLLKGIKLHVTKRKEKMSFRHINDLVIISDSLESWRQNSRRTIWFKVQTSDSQIVPTLVEVKFNSIPKPNHNILSFLSN